MILIISTELDQSTYDVLDWLLYMKEDYLVVTEKTPFKILELTIKGKFVLQIGEKILNSQDIKSVWYRRGGLLLEKTRLKELENFGEVRSSFQYYYNYEMKGIETFINSCLMGFNSINNENFSRVNKLMVLKNAEECGLRIPASIITSKKDVLLEFMKKHEKIITKSTIEGLFFKADNCFFNVYTEIVTKDSLLTLEKEFTPSFFQEYIPKQFEIRTFYLNEKIYSMAIFSQNNPKTEIDFRHYDHTVPNRTVPFKLSDNIENSLRCLMKSINNNSASIDFLYGKDKNIYFLEVNPIGQFGMTSYPCNYYLEREIAYQLIN